MNLRDLKIKQPNIDENLLLKYFSTIPYMGNKNLIISYLESGKEFKFFVELSDKNEALIHLNAEKFDKAVLVGILDKSTELFSFLEMDITDLNQFLEDKEFRNSFINSKKYQDCGTKEVDENFLKKSCEI